MKKRIIEYLIKKFLVGYHLRKNPQRRQVGVISSGSREIPPSLVPRDPTREC